MNTLYLFCNRAVFLLSTLSLLLGYSCSVTFAATGLLNNSLAPMLDEVLPSVVNISTRSFQQESQHPLLSDPFLRYFFGIPERKRQQEQEMRSLGSAVIIDANKGYLVTNYHVIEDADEIRVTLRDHRELMAQLIGYDPEVDLALLQIPTERLTALPLADSDQLRVGDFVVAIGNPFGLSQTVTLGIISALGRSGLGIEGYEDFIQTDASINPGNSGGALVTVQGELAGINTAIVGPNGANVGIGFAIPANMVKVIVQQLARYGKVHRGQLGVVMQDVTPELAEAFGLAQRQGAVITQVLADSPAEDAGLQAGDVVIAVNGKQISNSSELRNQIALAPIDTKIRLKILRHGKQRTLTATIGRIEPQATMRSSQAQNQFLVGALLGPIQQSHPLFGQVKGIQVIRVEQGTSAWYAGLRTDDIIASVNRKVVESVAEFNAYQGDSLLLHVLREDGALFIVLHH